MGFILALNDKKLERYTEEAGVTETVVPEGVTLIGENAFSGCDRLQKVILHEGLKYIGEGAFSGCVELQSVVIPGSVTAIEERAFHGCSSLQKVTISEGVTSIGEEAFCDCESLQSMNIPGSVISVEEKAFSGCYSLQELVLHEGLKSIGMYAFCGCGMQKINIPESVESIEEGAFEGCDRLQSVAIPEGVAFLGAHAFHGCSSLQKLNIPGSVTSIEAGLFFGCSNLQSVTIPEGVTSIGDLAFSDCSTLRHITIPESIVSIGKNIIGESEPAAFAVSAETLSRFKLPELWMHCILPDTKEELAAFCGVLNKCPKKIRPVFENRLAEEKTADVIAETFAGMIDESSSAKDCGEAAGFVITFCARLSPEPAKALYEKLKGAKKAVDALRKIEERPEVMHLIDSGAESADNAAPIKEKLLAIMNRTKQTETLVKRSIKEYYGLEAKSLPRLKCTDGSEAPEITLAWLLQAHEEKEGVGYKRSGISPDAEEIVDLLDGENLQKVLKELADQYLGSPARSKKSYLAYPICRYADENTMEQLTDTAATWESDRSGIDAPPLFVFRAAAMYSNTRSAMMFAEQYRELGKYAALRGMDEDTMRDRYLSDAGLDTNGCRQYDLGNQKITVRLQRDMTLAIEVPGEAKTPQSIPKKGADPDKYETAKTDFAYLKKRVRQIVKNRAARLFEDFLSGRSRLAADWKQAYVENLLLRYVAGSVVWMQKGHTFTLLADGKACDAHGVEYTISDKPVVVAHPIEMKADDVDAWQKYFRGNCLKQPFSQVWEPVVDPKLITVNRYKGVVFSYGRMVNMQKHGITIDDSCYGITDIEFKDCDAEIVRGYNGGFVVKSFEFDRYTRQVNHIVTYLDRITVFGRILKDDVNIKPWLDEFTLPQILEFIDLAAKNNCQNVSALLQQYKQEHFADADPMDVFTLDLL